MSEHRLTTLPSGVRVISERVPNVRSVALGFWIATGSALESDGQAGMSHLLEHMLFRGTDHFGSQEIDEIFDGMGAEINAGTDRESTSLYTRVLDRHLERAFEVAGEMVWRPLLEDLETEREVVLEEIAMYEDDPQDRVFDLLGEAVFGSHPLGRATIGTAAVVGSVTAEQLRAFHRERYPPAKVVVAAAGSVEHEALVDMAERAQAFADPQSMAAGGGNSRSGHAGELAESRGENEPDFGEPTFERRLRFLAKDTEQYHVCLGGRGISRHDERRFALRVLEGVLGGTSSSRLFQEVRERRGLAYSVFCFASQHRSTGEVGVYVGTRPDNLAHALEVIADELARLVEDPASAQELERSRENLKGRIALSLESTGSRMNRLGGSLLGELPILSVEEIFARIDAVSIEDLRALATELFAPEDLSVACIGREGELFERALEPLGGGEPLPAPGARREIGGRA
ncbi:MAG TPA: pitrilysin family protein [Solirubrobacteraceae bacterium]|nr:pitrilysin family protein [Solirubrobacteraceae bacterium]